MRRVLTCVALCMAVVVANYNSVIVAASADNGCIADPSDPSCASYVYPFAYNDMESLCHAPTGSMPYMTTCSIYDSCIANGVYSGAMSAHHHAECDLWTLLRTTCVHDGMAGMKGCANHTLMCAPTSSSSVIEACGDPMFTFLPKTRAVADGVGQICGSHYMEGCGDCVFGGPMNFPTNGCNMLASYAGLCLAMPGMTGCEAHDQMCSYADTNHLSLVQGYCKSGAGGHGSAVKATPTMNMFFTTQRNFYLLFKTWVPQTDGEYAGAWFAIFFMGIAVEALSLGKAWVEIVFVASRIARRKRRQMKKIVLAPGTELGIVPFPSSSADGVAAPVEKSSLAKPSPNDTTEQTCPPPPSFSSRQQRKEVLTDDRWTTRAGELVASYEGAWLLLDLLRLVLAFITTGSGYLLMLAAMCFNVGIFFAVVAGLAVGNVVAGHFRPVHYGEGVSAMDEDKVCHCC